MANSIEEALQNALNELLLKEYVIAAELDTSVSEDKPCNYIRKRFNVLHKLAGGDYTYSGKEVYVNKSDFTYKWHYGGGQLEATYTPFRDLLESKIPAAKASLGLDWLEIISADELTESGLALGIKGTTGSLADTWTIKAWKTGDTTVGFKVISKTTVS